MGLSGDPQEIRRRIPVARLPGFCFRAIQTTFTALIATHGLTVWNLIGNTLTIAFNAGMNLLFANGIPGIIPKMGVYGVALATALSRLFSSIILWWVLC